MAVKSNGPCDDLTILFLMNIKDHPWQIIREKTCYKEEMILGENEFFFLIQDNSTIIIFLGFYRDLKREYWKKEYLKKKVKFESISNYSSSDWEYLYFLSEHNSLSIIDKWTRGCSLKYKEHRDKSACRIYNQWADSADFTCHQCMTNRTFTDLVAN